MEDKLIEPVKNYNFFSEIHKENSKKYLDELIKKSGVDVELNRKTNKERRTELEKAENLDNEADKLRVKKTISIVVMIISVIIEIILLFITVGNPNVGLIVATSVFAVVTLTLIILLCKYISSSLNPVIKHLEDERLTHLNKAKELLQEAWRQMKALNRSFDWNIPAILFTRTIPDIKMDKEFDPKKFLYLSEKYNFLENFQENESTIALQSGSIYGNPFLFLTNRIQRMYKHTYTGSITITWSTTQRSSNGQLRTVNHSQVLTAEVVADKPHYDKETYLIYGNDAAPDLIFSRAGAKFYRGEDEKEREKVVKKNEDDLERLERNATKDGRNYTRLGNDEFETFFGGTNRNNEVQFRLLFTPLAQKNMLEVLYKSPYGDDFDFYKQKCLNYIRSKHSQEGYNVDPSIFEGFDIDMVQKFFIDFNTEYFKSVYFDLAPLLSIPLYVQNKALDYIYKREYRSNITKFEHEVLANSYDPVVFSHPESDTNIILKASLDEKNQDVDNITIKAHSFKAIRHVSYITKYGNDGRNHQVPVEWYEYIPLEQTSHMMAARYETTRSEFNDKLDNMGLLSGGFIPGTFKFQRGLITSLIHKSITKEEFNEIKED